MHTSRTAVKEDQHQQSLGWFKIIGNQPAKTSYTTKTGIQAAYAEAV